MVGTLPHHPMAVPIVGRELRKTLITIMTPELTRKAITSFDIRMFISIIIMLLMSNLKHGIKRHVHFVDYITMHFLSVGKEWEHTEG